MRLLGAPSSQPHSACPSLEGLHLGGGALTVCSLVEGKEELYIKGF